MSCIRTVKRNIKRMRIVCVANKKGGCGKTTTSICLGSCLAKEHNAKVLIIDADFGQASATRLLLHENWAEGSNKEIKEKEIKHKTHIYLFKLRN